MAEEEFQPQRMVTMEPHWTRFEVFDENYYGGLELFYRRRIDSHG